MFRLMKLNPPHGWNAVLWELAIVTLGVLIALGAQQMVEGWSWDRKVATAEQTMNEEIKNSLLAVAEINRLEECSTVQLVALQNAIISSDPVKARKIFENGTAFGTSRLWADNAFVATLAAQVSDHLGSDKLKSYSQVYQMIRAIRDIQSAPETKLSHLAMLYFLPNRPASREESRAQLLEVVNARLRMQAMRESAEPLVFYAKRDLGLEMTQPEYLAAPGRAENIKLCEAHAVQAKS